jgi:MFS family permease
MPCGVGEFALGPLSDRSGQVSAFPGTRPGFVLLSAGANSPVFAALLTDRLQGPRLGFLLGLQNIGFGAGAMLGPLLFGILFDRLGSYTLAFSLMGASIVLSSLIVTATAGRHPRSASG